ncbi:hypothetical protein [Acinetobacter sp. ANC 4193]
MIDVAALTVSTVLNIGILSRHSGSSFVQHTISESNYHSTGSISPNFAWLAEQARSGQSYTIVNQQKTVFEQRLDFIKSTFSLTEEELAESVGVKRKTLFNWKQQKSEPSKDKTQKIFELYLLAKNWKNAQLPSNPSQLNNPVLAGKSVKDMLQEVKLDSEKILFAGNRLAHQSIGEMDLI